MTTKRIPLPRGSIEEIDNALMEIADSIRTCLVIGRKPEADGRLSEIVHHLYQAKSYLDKAKITAKAGDQGELVGNCKNLSPEKDFLECGIESSINKAE